MHVFDFEKRTTEFAIQIIRLCKMLPKNTINEQLVRQLVRSAGSLGANYREANDALGNKDVVYRLKISSKESKESHHWLMILKEANPGFGMIQILIKEADELRRILCAMITKLEKFKL